MSQSTGRPELQQKLCPHLATVYPDIDYEYWAEKIVSCMRYSNDLPNVAAHQNHWDQSDIALITYGDSIVSKNEKPLVTLHQFLRNELQESINILHILPFFPYSSDDGFAVMDYTSVNPSLGDWPYVTALSKDFRLMADLVINHASARSRWFENFRKCIDPGKDYFFTADKNTDISKVVRPRNTPLLNAVQTAEGEKLVWCTFGKDQVDLDFSNPKVLLEFVNIISHYMEWGVEIFRLDAVGFLWKKPGTSSLHLPQTHELIKVLRLLIEHKNPRAIVITETNVPNRENITYFGNANEAHAVYNFSLPPLLVNTMISGNCQHLKSWMMSMPPAQNGTAYLNFIASHDGIGLRPAEGLLQEQEITQLIEAMQSFGGLVSFRKGPGGFEKPYEINISLWDAMKGTLQEGEDSWQFQRFFCAHAIMLALEGIPALYIHSLLGTPNDHKSFENTGHKRAINRHKWERSGLQAALEDSALHHRKVLDSLKRLISIRSLQPAFHPNVTQYTLQLGDSIFSFWRQSLKRDQSIFCLNNVTNRPQQLLMSDLNLIDNESWFDLIGENSYGNGSNEIILEPYQSAWLTNCRY